MAKQVTRKPPITPVFRRGVTWGRQGIFRGNLYVEQSEEGIVEIIQNLIDFALEGNLTEELLRQDAGIIVGFVLGYDAARNGLSLDRIKKEIEKCVVLCANCHIIRHFNMRNKKRTSTGIAEEFEELDTLLAVSPEEEDAL